MENCEDISIAPRFVLALLHTALVEYFEDPATIAALCRVSKRFHSIFTPVLYKNILLHVSPFGDLCKFTLTTPESSLGSTSSIYLFSKLNVIFNTCEFDEQARALVALLKKAKNISTLTIIGPALLGNAQRSEEKPSNLTALTQLSRCDNLTSLTLVDSNDAGALDIRLPVFIGLRELEISGLSRSPTRGNLEDIVETLIASPNLKRFGISLSPWGTALDEDFAVDNNQAARDNRLLRSLIQTYKRRRVELELEESQTLRLSSLRFGFGVLPILIVLDFGADDDYLSKLTDLHFLRELRIDNGNFALAEDDPTYFPVHVPLFTKATSLKTLSVERLSSDIVHIIKLLCDTEDSQLDELEVRNYLETLAETEDYDIDTPFPEDEYMTIHSVPLKRAGFHWRKLSYGSKFGLGFRTPQEILDHCRCLIEDFLPQCHNLEELTMPLQQEYVDLMKTMLIKSANRKLHTLMLPCGHIADLYPPRPYGNLEDMPSEELLRTVNREQEQQRLDFVKDFFTANIQLAQEDKATSLKYLGVGSHVYSWLLARSDTPSSMQIFSVSSDEQKYQVVKFSTISSKRFDVVRMLDWEYATYTLGL